MKNFVSLLCLTHTRTHTHKHTHTYTHTQKDPSFLISLFSDFFLFFFRNSALIFPSLLIFRKIRGNSVFRLWNFSLKYLINYENTYFELQFVSTCSLETIRYRYKCPRCGSSFPLETFKNGPTSDFRFLYDINPIDKKYWFYRFCLFI